jgi:hypothetical protein
MDKLKKIELVRFLQENLRFSVEGGGFTDPNNRTVKVTIGGAKVTEFSFDVVQRDEYEG